MTAKQAYQVEQLDGRPETDPVDRMYSVIDPETGRVVASWRETPITGLTYKDAIEIADSWSALEGRAYRS